MKQLPKLLKADTQKYFYKSFLKKSWAFMQ